MNNLTNAASLLALIGSITVATNAMADDSPKMKTINPSVAFPEGPIYKGRTLYYVAFGGSSVLSWDGQVNKTIYTDKKCGPTSVTALGNDLLVACYDGNFVAHIRSDGTLVARVDKDTNGSPILGPNDFAPDGKGGVYLTGSGPTDTASVGGKVYHIDSNVQIKEIAKDIHFANGIALAPDGRRLLVAESEAQRILSFAVATNGALSDRRLFARLNKLDPQGGIDAYPDGIKFGPDGNLWVGEYSKARIAIISGDGTRFIRGYDFPGEAAPNLAFAPGGHSFAVMVVYDKNVEPWSGAVYEVSID